MSEWFPIDALHQKNEPVKFWLGEGVLVGKLTERRGNKIFLVRSQDRKFRPLPKHCKPFAWKPIGLWSWELPAPITEVKTKVLEPQEITGSAYFEKHDSIPRVRLGAWNERPASLLETEARLLRGIRTQQHLDGLDHVGHKPKTVGWPPALMAEARAVQKWLENTPRGEWGTFRHGDYQDFHIDRSNKDAMPARWQPTPRDIGDVEIDQGNILTAWAGHLTARQWRILVARAARPPFSWVQISERENLSDTSCQRHFRKAITTSHWRAHQ